MARKRSSLALADSSAFLGEAEHAAEFENPNIPRYKADRLVHSYAERDLLRTHVVRPSPVTHGLKREHAFVSTQIKVAKEKGEAAYIADSDASWTAVHVEDAAQIYVRALEGTRTERHSMQSRR